MEVDFSQTRFKFTIREIVLLFTFMGGLVTHVIRTEVQNETLQKEIAAVQVDLRQCQDKLARR
jgi:hypothetical protein